MLLLTWCNYKGSREVFGDLHTINAVYSYLLKDEDVSAIHVYDRGQEVDPNRGFVPFVSLTMEDKLNNNKG